MKRIFITPQRGATIFDPETNEPVPATGADVVETKYILRRIADGDATISEMPVKRSK